MRTSGLPGGFSYIRWLMGFLFCVAVYYAFLGRVDPDEVESIHTAWNILAGGAIYRDFFQHHHPLFYYLLVPVIEAGGETLLSFYLAEFLAFAIFAGIVVTTFFLAEKIYGDRVTSWFSVVLVLTFPYFIYKGTEIRPDILQVFLGLLSFYFLVVHLDGKAKRHLVLSALLLSLSFMVLQKAVFLIFVTGLALLYYLFRSGDEKISGKDFFLYWAVFLSLPASYVAFLYVTGGLQNYFDFNWLINVKYQFRFSPFRYFPVDLSSLSRKFLMTLSAMVFAVLLIRGCYFKTDKHFGPTGVGLHWLVVTAAVLLGASFFFVPAPHSQYLLMASPFFALAAAFYLRRFSDSTVRKYLMVLVFLCASFLISQAKDGREKEAAVQTMRYVLSVSSPSDAYFGYKRSNLFRKDASFFWFCYLPGKCVETYQSFRDYDHDPVRIIMEAHPKVIHRRSDEFYDAIVEHPYVVRNYERSSEYSQIYLRKDGS